MKTMLIAMLGLLLSGCGKNDEEWLKEIRAAAWQAAYKREEANEETARPTDMVDYQIAKARLEELKLKAAESGVENYKISSEEDSGSVDGRAQRKKFQAEMDALLGRK